MATPKKLALELQKNTKPVTSGELAALGGRKLVYIRAIPASDVLDDLEEAVGEGELEFDANATLYSVHAADGERIALVGDRDIAFAAARQYEMNPVSVH